MSLTTMTLFAAFTLPPQRPAADPPTAGPDCYYVLLFGGHGNKLRPETGHTWITFVRSNPQPDGSVRIDPFTISWMPTSMNVRPLRLRSEPGKNFTLQETLDFMFTGRHEIALWGPFEINACFFEEACRHKRELDGGASRYRVFDGLERRKDVNNCVHAIVRTDPAWHAATDPILSNGKRITQRVADAMVKVGLVTEPTRTHDWLIPALGLDRYDFDRGIVGQRISLIGR
jgi:hypothetical protein